MRNMLKEFYDFIARKINSYFQTASSEKTLLPGETFFLKLDEDDMVVKVANALQELVSMEGNIGEFVLPCANADAYKTFTIKLMNDEIIIAPQINGMTSDFLCATLRNAANSVRKPILMISSTPIDSAISGSKNMSASGMPFYGKELMREIEDMVKESSQLTPVEKQILRFELKRREGDVFSDKTSLYEYGDLLAIMSAGKIQRESFAGFRLFYVDGKTEYFNESQDAVYKKIKENNCLFERLDKCLKFGNLSSDLTKDFDDSFITKIESEQRKDPENWSYSFAYAEMLAQIEKHRAKLDNPLQIENEDIFVYGTIPMESLGYGAEWIVRNEGSQVTKKRQKNIIIFNAEKKQQLHIRFTCNAKVLNSGISADGLQYEKEGKDFIFEIFPSGVYFKKIELYDETNDIKYIFKICVVDLQASSMLSVIKHCYTIDFRRKKDVRIRLSGIGTDLIFNEGASEVVNAKLDDNESYFCAYNQRLHLYSTEDELTNYSTGIRINIDFAGVNVPFIMYPDESKSREITGRGILKEKYASRSSFEFIEDRICRDTQEYFAKARLLRELRIEKQFIDEKIAVGKCKRFHDTDQIKILGDDIFQDRILVDAYEEYLEALRRANTIPTLAYLKGDLLDSAQKYVNAFMRLYSTLGDGATLTSEQVNALYIGTISVGTDAEEILLTPLHPINVAYQIALIKENGMEDATDVIIDRLTSLNLLPYLKRKKKIYKVSDQVNSLEWKYYSPVENKKYRGNWRFVPRLIEEKICEFLMHFKYIFDDINNRTLKINLINMGDCSEVFTGIAQFFIHSINRNPNTEDLIHFELHIHSDKRIENAFSRIREFEMLKQYLSDQKLEIASGVSMSTLEGIFSKNIECYFHKDNGKNYQYAHLSFYEMESEITSEQASMTEIETGISLGGMLSGIPSSQYSTKYRTGYGAKYAPQNGLVNLSNLYNSLIQVESSGNPYYKGLSISTQIDEKAENKMAAIYSASNWVIFVDPKVDLDFFSEKEATNDLLIIHYSDQYTTSSGYDAITVTQKSKQYSLVIQDYLKNRGVEASKEDVHGIINLFNAVNGDWLLRLISSKRAEKDSTFSREKISIVAAIKFMLAFLRHKDIVWVPISLEEMLRVSRGAGLSQGEGLLSAKNLGFEKGPTSDDLLFVGVDTSANTPKIYLYPTEVKTGKNPANVIKKAFQQASSTAKGLGEAFEKTDNNDITKKVNRNFLMQLIITSCKKMKVYHVDDSQNWDIVLDQVRKALLNEEYIISNDIQELLGKGAVLSFRTGIISRRASFKEDVINFIEVPETDEFGLILKSVEEIKRDIVQRKDSELLLFDGCDISGLTGDMSKMVTSEFVETEKSIEDANEVNSENTDTDKVPAGDVTISTKLDSEYLVEDKMEPAAKGMRIIIGTDENDGTKVIWKPNDTTQLFHTNTGIIGTMGTGKTQFTKALITQIFRSQKDNVDGKELGILIFDYKGDYNESKQDFIDATKATIYKPYHLPFNPLALTKSSVFKPLLPTHTANAFKDTLSKVYNLGPKQQATLLQCIMDTYTTAGILPGDPSTWDNEAPTFDQVYQRYANDTNIKKGDSLTAALEKLNIFQIFEDNPSKTKSLFELLKGVVVIDLSGYDPDIQSLVVAITLDLFYAQMQASGSSKMDGQYRQLTKIILVDEADNFMSEGFPVLKKILKEGREFGIGTILSTQFLKHFGSGEDDYSKYILTWIVHNVSDLKNSDVDFVFKTESKSGESIRLYNSIKRLKIHHSIIKIGNNKPIYLQDKAFWELYDEIKNS